MASPLDLRGRAVISDGASATLNTIKGKLDSVYASARKLGSVQYLDNVNRSINRAADRATAAYQRAAQPIKSIIDQTKDFNEANFGYGFARITDYIKDGKLDLQGLRVDMDAAAKAAVEASKAYSTLPKVTMKAREEVEKLGFKGDTSKSVFEAAMGLHTSEPTALAAGEAAKYVGAVYRAYDKEKKALAEKLGKDADDPEFNRMFIKGLAGKAAVAGAESALGPADVVEGMRQFAPQWAAMGIDYDFALAMLAHGSNFGFRAPELGTAFKSMVTRINNPTAQGLGVLNRAGINLNDYRAATPAAPDKAANQLGSLLLGAPYAGKGGMAFKQQIKEQLDFAHRNGLTATPEFQNEITNQIMGRLGPGWAGRIDEVRQSVSNATMTSGGGLQLGPLLKKMVDSGLSVGEIATTFEGRHIARYTPTFQAWEKMIELYTRVQNSGGEVLDATVEARKASEAGKTDAMSGAWERLMIALDRTAVVDTAKTSITGLLDTVSSLGSAANELTAGLIGVAGAIGVALAAAKMLPGAAAGAGAGAGATGGAGAAAGAATAAARGSRIPRWLRWGGGLGAIGWLAEHVAEQNDPKYALDRWNRLRPEQQSQARQAGIDKSWGLDGMMREADSLGGYSPAQVVREGGEQTKAALDETASGVRTGGAAIAEAMQSAAAQIAAAASSFAAAASRAYSIPSSSAVNLNTGPNMRPAQ